MSVTVHLWVTVTSQKTMRIKQLLQPAISADIPRNQLLLQKSLLARRRFSSTAAPSLCCKSLRNRCWLAAGSAAQLLHPCAAKVSEQQPVLEQKLSSQWEPPGAPAAMSGGHYVDLIAESPKNAQSFQKIGKFGLHPWTIAKVRLSTFNYKIE